MSTKNPFEIRTELLQMAKDYLDQQQSINMEFARSAFELAVESGKSAAEALQDLQPKMYDMSDVIKKAQELYGFVSRKD